MKNKRFTEDQIVHALARKSADQTMMEIYCRLGVVGQTFYQKKFGADPLRVHEAPARGASHADQGHHVDAPALRLPEDPRATASRELAGQSQVHGASPR